jgi:hypothetical protein
MLLREKLYLRERGVLSDELLLLQPILQKGKGPLNPVGHTLEILAQDPKFRYLKVWFTFLK